MVTANQMLVFLGLNRPCFLPRTDRSVEDHSDNPKVAEEKRHVILGTGQVELR